MNLRRSSSAPSLHKLLLLPLALAGAAAAAACGGATSSDGGASATAAAPAATSPSSPSDGTGSSPSERVYTGLVATTDVSILYPLPPAGASTDFVRPGEAGRLGELLSRASLVSVLGDRRLDDAADASVYDELRIVGIRLDPCSSRGGAGCRTEVRVIFQALSEHLTGPTGEPVAGVAATDGAVHVFYDVSEAELTSMMKQILALKKANGGLGLEVLGPHPILEAQGLSGPFAQGLRAILLDHLTDARIGRITFFDHDGTEGHSWTFRIFERASSGFGASPIAGSDAVALTVSGASAFAPLAESSAFGVPAGVLDSVEALIDGRAAGGGTASAAERDAFAAAIRLQNPDVHIADTTDCASCHLAEGARRIGEAVYGLHAGQDAFTSTRSLARRNEGTSVTNLHAFGYLGRQISIMQRTANESAVAASRMEAKIQ